METTPSDGSDVTNADGSTKPFWMKSKLAGGEWSFYFFICQKKKMEEYVRGYNLVQIEIEM